MAYKCKWHNVQRNVCVECYKNGTGGASICPCLKQKRFCRVHGGGALCPCGKQKHGCVKCGGKAVRRCRAHDRIFKHCIPCGGKGRKKCYHGLEYCKNCNPLKYFTHNIRKLTSDALARNGQVKNKKTIELLGVSSFDTVREHLEVKCKIWNDLHPKNQISITNMEIDHIKPVVKFDDSEKAKREVNHYTNLQPLPRDVNMHKSAKWSDKDEEFWRANIIGNAEFREIYLPCVMD